MEKHIVIAEDIASYNVQLITFEDEVNSTLVLGVHEFGTPIPATTDQIQWVERSLKKSNILFKPQRRGPDGYQLIISNRDSANILRKVVALHHEAAYGGDQLELMFAAEPRARITAANFDPELINAIAQAGHWEDAKEGTRPTLKILTDFDMTHNGLERLKHNLHQAGVEIVEYSTPEGFYLQIHNPDAAFIDAVKKAA